MVRSSIIAARCARAVHQGADEVQGFSSLSGRVAMALSEIGR